MMLLRIMLYMEAPVYGYCHDCLN